MKNYRSRATVRVLLNLLSDPAAIVDGKGNFLTVNDAFEEVTGQRRKELVGTPLLRLNIVTPETKSVLLENLKNRLQGAPVESYEVCFRGKLGEKRCVEVTGKRVSYAGQPASLVVFHDVTDQKKKADEQIRSSEEKYKNLFENAPDVIVTIDLKGKITSVNKAIMQYGFRENEIVGSDIFKLVPVEYSQKLLTGLKSIAAGNPAQGEIEILTLNGKRSAEYSSNPIWLNGKVVGYQTIMRDVTERKKAEEALRGSEEKHRKLFEESMDAIFVADAATGIIVDCNPAASKLVGREKSELVGHHQSIVFPQEQIEGEFTRSFKKHLKDPTKTLETQIMRKTGEIRDVAVKATVFELEGKQLMQGTFRDITEHKRSEEELRRAEKKFRIYVENSPVAVFVADPEGKYEYVNEAASKLLGYSAKELMEMSIPQIIFKEEHPTLNSFAALQETGKILVEVRLKKKDGQAVYASLNAVKLPDGKLIAFCENITERKHAEEALTESDERSRAIVANAPIGIATSGADKHFLSANDAFCRILGYTEDELLKLTFKDITHSEDLKESAIKMGELENGRISFTLEKRYVKKDGTVIDGKIMVSAVRNQNGKLSLFIAELEDTTERKKAEELRKVLERKVDNYSEHLKSMVELRTAQLKDANERLVKSERLAAIGELAGMVGHDLRNPLAGIKNAAYFLKKKGTTISEAQAKEMLEIIDKAIDHSDKIINDLLDYSREMHLELTKYAAHTLVDEATRMIQVPDRIQIVNHVHEETLIWVNADKMMRVFINLIKNAIDAMPEKGTVEISSCQTRDCEEIAFADTGIGIPDETLPKMFSPLFTTKAQGMGFGLAICKRIVESHGGTITVKTAVDKGTTFTITLPIKSKLEVGGEKTWINMPESLLSTTTRA
jgi:PAS domain S-box-containing protein